VVQRVDDPVVPVVLQPNGDMGSKAIGQKALVDHPLAVISTMLFNGARDQFVEAMLLRNSAVDFLVLGDSSIKKLIIQPPEAVSLAHDFRAQRKTPNRPHLREVVHEMLEGSLQLAVEMLQRVELPVLVAVEQLIGS
jgi:hypothetical protein